MDAIKTGALIAQARKEKNLTQKDLAQALHVSIQAVSKWERGLNFPDIALMEPLAELLDLTVSELMAGERNAAPEENLVRESLRTGLHQLGGKARKWRRLFAALSVAVVLVGGFSGYRWVRDNTEWLPQRETVVIPQEVSDSERKVATLLGTDVLGSADMLRADDFQKMSVWLELWDGGTLLDSTRIMGAEGYEKGTNARRVSMSYLLQLQEGEMLYSFYHEGAVVRSRSYPIPKSEGWGWTTLRDPVEVDRETGTVLACVGLDNGNGIRVPQVGNYKKPQLDAGQIFLLLRLVVE